MAVPPITAWASASIAEETGNAPHAAEADSSILWEIFRSVRRVGDSANVSIAAEADSRYDPLCHSKSPLFQVGPFDRETVPR